MDDFKDLINRAAINARRELILVKNKKAVEPLIVKMLNEAGEKGLCPIYRSADQTILMGDSLVCIRIVHANIDRHMAGTTWHAIHGMELCDDFDRPYDMKLRLASLVRLP